MQSPKGSRGSLPEHIRHDPAMMDWRVTRLEERVDEIESKPPTGGVSDAVSLPRLLLLGALLFAGLNGHLAPDTAWQLARGLLGIVWRSS